MVVDGQKKGDTDVSAIELPSTIPVGAFNLRTLSHKSKNVEID